jgi:hypothetical protein
MTHTAGAADRRRISDQKAADRLRDHGWLVMDPAYVERRQLHRLLVLPISDVTQWAMAEYGRTRAGRDLPTLHWHWQQELGGKELRGHVTWRDEFGADPAAALAPWVELFGLEQLPAGARGSVATTEFTGEVDGIKVYLWCETKHDGGER